MTRGMLLSHPTGNANVRAALAGLQAGGILAEFHTTIATYRGNLWDKLGNQSWGREFKRRGYDERLRSVTVQHPARELGRMLVNKAKIPALGRHEQGAFCIDAVYRTLDKKVAGQIRKHRDRFSGAYTYEDGALETLTAAKETGLKRVYELPIAYWKTARQLLAEEAERLPNWKVTMGGGVSDSQEKLDRKTRELELAEMVICPSQFVARSLPDAAKAGKKVVFATFGSPANSAPKNPNPAGKKLRVLFAGSMGQRKGLGDLFAAVRLLKRTDVELVVIGSPQSPLEFYRGEYDGFIFEASRPHAQVLELMRQCDVFCLPSIVEGRALVMQEAMSQGLPLIITPNTGGEDLVEEGVTGFLVPIRRPDLIAEKIGWFADNRTALPAMSRAAQTKAAQLTWEKYGETIAQAIIGLTHA